MARGLRQHGDIDLMEGPGFPHISNEEIQGYFKGNYRINGTFVRVFLENC